MKLGNMFVLMIASAIHPNTVLTLHTEFENSLHEVMEKYFHEKTVLVYDARITHGTRIRELLPQPDDLELNAVLRVVMGDGKRSVKVNNRLHWTEKKERLTIYKPKTSIFFFNQEQMFSWPHMNQLFSRIKSTEHWKRQGRTLIIAWKSNPELGNSEMAKNAIAGTWRWNKAANVLVMIAEEQEINFHIWFPYRQPYCRWVDLLPVYDTWRGGSFVHGLDLYPTKIKRDFEGCPLRICSSECLPYTFKNYTDGFEAKLVRLLSEYFNFSLLEIALPGGEDIWTTFAPNGTIIGGFGQLNLQQADLIFACIMLNEERYNLAETLPTYFHDSLTWFVPTPDLKSHASNIFEAFPAQYWTMIVGTTLAALLTFLLIHKLEDYALSSGPPQNLINAGLRVFAMALSSPFTTPSRNWLLRMMTFAFAIYSLHITTVYQASLYNLYKSNSYSNVYNTLEDAVDNGLFVWLKSSTKGMYDADDGIWQEIMHENRHAYVQDDLDTPFDQVAIEKTAILLFIKTTMLTYIREYYTDSNRMPMMLYLPEQFASYPVTLFLSPGHPLFEKMSDLVHIILGAGMVDHWLSQVVHFKNDNNPPTSSNLSLQLEHIGGAFMFYAALIAIAVGVFLIEQVYWFTHGRKVAQPLGSEERNIRRQLLFRAVVDLSRDRVITRLGRFRSTNEH